MRKNLLKKQIPLVAHYFFLNIFYFLSPSVWYLIFFICILYWLRLNYATNNHDPPPSTTTHHQQKYIHHHPPPAKIYPLPPTTSQNISTTIPNISQKMDHHPAKAKIYWHITSFRHCFNSFFFLEMQYSFPWWRFCVIKFWSVRFSNSKFLLHSVHFTIFKIF